MDYKHNTRQIEVLDAIMGSGKTTGIIEWMLDHPNNKYLYVSPLLHEVEERIPSECESLGFVAPNTEQHNTKGEHLLELLKGGHNVSFTHSLFTSLSREHLYWIDLQNYVLIIDEEIDFIEPYKGRDYKTADILTLEKSGHIRVNEESLGRVEWTWDEDAFVEGGNYTKLRRMCDLEMLHCSKRSREMMVLHLPIALIGVSERTIVLTYLFEGSVMSRFMAMKGVTVKPFTEAKLKKTEAQVKQEACERIEIFRTRTTHKVRNYNLTYSWYTQRATEEQLKKVQNAIVSACRKGSADDVIYTLPKEMLYGNPSVAKSRRKAKIRPNGYSKEQCFLYCGTRATNEYAKRTVLVHAYNRYPQQTVNAYLTDYWLPVDSDNFALAEMIQWVWRSNIRDSHSKSKVYLCILSRRMEGLFKEWLDYSEEHL